MTTLRHWSWSQQDPKVAFKARVILMRVQVVHDLVNAHLLSAGYITKAENPARAFTQGLSAAEARKARELL
eukprot:12898066-Prorocentrum_lima.AAC.1